ncbi:hypothetical protein [Streptomyces sp. NPDC090994]|uniref:hypothetical protein n=1 Tax=Streptomyces sp. NPDC090994 TaxID=3365969 RepID=UPI00382C5264
MFDVEVPVAPTLVERLLALAGLYTEHNDRIDLLLAGTAAPAPDAYVSSARRLEREALACVKAVRQQRLAPVEPVPSAVVRLKQTAYLTSGATRYLTSAQQSLPTDDAAPARLDRRRGFGQHVRQARELTALAPATVVESTTHFAYRLPAKAHAHTTVPGMDGAQRRSLLMIARGHVAVTGHYEAGSHDRTDSVDTDMLRRLDAQGLVTCDAASAPPFYSGGQPRDRVRLTPLGLSVLSTVIAEPLPAGPPTARPVPAPAATPSARTRR